MRTLPLALIALACLATALPAAAQSAGDWTVALGAHHVNPKSNNGSLAGGTLPLSIGGSTRPTIAVEYFVRDRIGVELLAATPFRHDLDIAGLGRIGSTKHLPPTLSLQYHFAPYARVAPFLGAGLNYTTFFEEETRGALAGPKLALGDSWAWRCMPASTSKRDPASCGWTRGGWISRVTCGWTG